ncbi:hypothetical protein ACTWP5_30165 [Streptomyces sp. 4N509B]
MGAQESVGGLDAMAPLVFRKSEEMLQARVGVVGEPDDLQLADCQ